MDTTAIYSNVALVWYDRHQRVWVVQDMDAEGNQIGNAEFSHRKSDAMDVARSIGKKIVKL